MVRTGLEPASAACLSDGLASRANQHMLYIYIYLTACVAQWIMRPTHTQ